MKQAITQAAIETAKAIVVTMIEVSKEGRRSIKCARQANTGERMTARAG